MTDSWRCLSAGPQVREATAVGVRERESDMMCSWIRVTTGKEAASGEVCCRDINLQIVSAVRGIHFTVYTAIAIGVGASTTSLVCLRS